MTEFDFLPEQLRTLSLSEDEVILPLEEAKAAVEILEKHGFLILAWEGWLKYSDGAFGHSIRHPGTSESRRLPDEDWDSYTLRSKQYFLKTATEHQAKFTAKPENPGSQLYFCLIFEHKDD